ncbi:MAG: trypsin-like peptidase domain-containing protein [Burkholderiales bacterium]
MNSISERIMSDKGEQGMYRSSKLHIGSAILFWVAMALTSRAGLALEANEIFKLVDPSIVVVRVPLKDGEVTGSGVLLTPSDIVTSCHVVEKGNKIIVDQGSVRRSAKIRFQDSARDLCQIKLDDTFPNGKPITGTVASKDLEVGQPVFAVGSPRGLERTISRGIVSGLREQTGEAGRLVQTDAAISPGSSGGGLFDAQGRLVGVTTLTFRDSQNLNFAIPAEWIAELPARNRDRLPDARSADGSSVPAPVASGSEPLPEWMPRVGDRAKYRFGFGKVPRHIGSMMVEIAGVTENRVTERLTIDNTRTWSTTREVDVGFDPTRFVPRVELPGGYQLLEISPYAAPSELFETGKQWPDVQAQIGFGVDGVQIVKFKVKVAGREKVVVPAGTFDTWKIEAVGIAESPATRGTIKLKTIHWISANAKRTVKIRLEQIWSWSSISSYETYELTGYESSK